MTERWLRWYDGTVRDGKMVRVAKFSNVPVATVIGVWASILEDAATSDPRGRTSRCISHHAEYLDLDVDVIETIWNGLERYGTVRTVGTVSDENRQIEVVNWGKRQYESEAKDT